MMKRLYVILFAFTIIFSLTACGTQTATTSGSEAAPVPTEEAAPAPTAEPAQPSAAPEEEITPEAASASAAEQEAEPVTETWYGLSRGLPVTLSLVSDGSYTLSFAGEETSGTWTEEGGDIFLNGEEAASFLRLDDKIRMADGVFLYTGQSGTGSYTPAEVITEDVTAEAFNGYWTSLYVQADGAILYASDVNDVTDVYVEGTHAALGGPMFGDVLVDMTFKNGALIFAEGSISVKLELQADGLMRMTCTGTDGELVLYLISTYVEGVTDEE